MKDKALSHRITPHQHQGRFFNHPDEKRNSIFLRSLIMYAAGWRMRNSGLLELSEWHQHNEPWSSQKSFQGEGCNISSPKPGVTVQPGITAQPGITWIGHASFLVQIGGYNILTDPVFNDLTLLFKRIQKPGIAREELPRIDAVIISHNHRDHMERETLQYLAKKFPECIFLVPRGDKRWLKLWKIEQVIELDWWQDYQLQHPGKAAVRFIFLPAHHWSQRGLFDMNRSLWGSWMIEHQDQKLYFAGDTAYSHHFQSVAKEFSGINCVLMPIGPCEPNKWMKKSHINAEEAGHAFLELGAQTMIPMHWGTYKFGIDRPLVPIERLLSWWETNVSQEQQNKKVSLAPLKIGQSILLP